MRVKASALRLRLGPSMLRKMSMSPNVLRGWISMAFARGVECASKGGIPPGHTVGCYASDCMVTLRHAVCFSSRERSEWSSHKMAESHTSNRESLLRDPEHWK